jgi:hypothetical protein
MSSVYRVTFRSPDTDEKAVLRCKEVTDSPLGLGFVCLSGFDFGPAGRIVDPGQEQLQKRFAETQRLHLHIHSVMAVEELSGAELLLEGDRSNLVVFPPAR